MPLRSPKMYSFIFGFQRRVWWPKWTPASSSSFMVSVATGRLLTFRPLEALARSLLAVLLALLHPRVAGEEAAAAELGFQLGVGQGQGPRQAHPHRARLAGAAAAADADVGVVLVGGADEAKRLAGMLPPGVAHKKLVELAPVHPDLAGARAQGDAGHGSLAAPGAVVGTGAECRGWSLERGFTLNGFAVNGFTLNGFTVNGLRFSRAGARGFGSHFGSRVDGFLVAHLALGLHLDGLRLLGDVRVLGVGKDPQLLGHALVQLVLGEHPQDGVAHHLLGLGVVEVAGLDFLQAARIAAVPAINFLVELLAGEADAAGVDDDDVVAAQDAGGEGGLGLAHQQAGDTRGEAAEHLAVSVHQMPLLPAVRGQVFALGVIALHRHTKRFADGAANIRV